MIAPSLVAAFAAVLRGEEAAFLQPDAHRLEVAGRGDAVEDDGIRIVGARGAARPRPGRTVPSGSR